MAMASYMLPKLVDYVLPEWVQWGQTKMLPEIHYSPFLGNISSYILTSSPFYLSCFHLLNSYFLTLLFEVELRKAAVYHYSHLPSAMTPKRAVCHSPLENSLFRAHCSEWPRQVSTSSPLPVALSDQHPVTMTINMTVSPPHNHFNAEDEGSMFLQIIINILSGMSLSPLGIAATIGVLYQPLMIDDGDCGATSGIKIGRGN
jgi:hypothetical protein